MNDVLQKCVAKCAKAAYTEFLTRVLEHDYIKREFADRIPLLEQLLIADTQQLMPLIVSLIRDAALQGIERQ